MNTFDIRQPWQPGSLFMTAFEVENSSTADTVGRVLGDLMKSCTVAGNAINKMMGK